MKKYLCLLIILLFSCNNNNENKIAIVIHGGAGIILKENISKSKEDSIINKLDEAISKGWELLNEGKSSELAVIETIKILEDSPLFNAGKGSVFNSEERVENDASIMRGNDLNAGASSGTSNVKNPITLAADVMNYSDHVFLSGKGAEIFAKDRNLEIVENEYFHTEFRYNQLLSKKEDNKYGTVGCVAIDINGNIVAGTSTGGMTNKKWGRIGDSPIIGAGTYANNNTCGISSTGSGEYFIRTVAAYQVSSLLENHDYDLGKAMSKVIHEKIGGIGGDGGMIGIDKNSNIVMDFNTPGMYRAYVNKDGQKKILLYKN
ncbi:MAG: beta-aspartyl-peptidase [Flavobacteriaceae bacterium]|nr:beta-aspartyl-peptidase [Flavobacteriaceae bacterium]|tara:strand:+ start:242 stop:1195 length:954 start_codon:yes stop_codon:yes gene_type:complete